MEKQVIETLAANLSELMERGNLKAPAVEKMTGVSDSYINELKNPKHNRSISIRLLARLAKGFRLEPWQLITSPEVFIALLDCPGDVADMMKAFALIPSAEGRAAVLRLARLEAGHANK